MSDFVDGLIIGAVLVGATWGYFKYREMKHHIAYLEERAQPQQQPEPS